MQQLDKNQNLQIDLYLHILQTCCNIKKKIYKNYDFSKFYNVNPDKTTLEQTSVHFLTISLIKQYQESLNKHNSDPLQDFVRVKHQKYIDLEKSVFISHYKNYRNTLIKAQKSYLAISRFVQICKQKSKPYNDTDLTLTPITKESNTIKIYQNKKLYVFTLFDLINIIEKMLCNCDCYFVEPLVIKNPYNNIEFTHAQLYNIYFKIKESPYIMPELFHGYFKSNFIMKLFSVEYESQIRNTYIHNQIYKTNNKVLFEELRTMVFNVTRGKYKIEKKLCETSQLSEFVHIMRPYYYLYLYGYKYVNGLEKTNRCYDALKYKISELFYYNPYFGKVKMKREPITKKFRKIVDLEHPKFTINDIKNFNYYHTITRRSRQHILFDYDDEDTESDDDDDDAQTQDYDAQDESQPVDNMQIDRQQTPELEIDE